MLPEFDLLRPKTLPEALAMLAGGKAMPIAGGTNVVVDLRAGRGGITSPPGARAGNTTPTHIGRPRPAGGAARHRRADGHLVIGGGTTISDLLGTR